MTKRIFRSIWLVALCVFLASVVLIMGVMYAYFTNVQFQQLHIHCDLAAQGINSQGLAYLEELELKDCRLTWITAEGDVLYDSQSDAQGMENHANREEIREALQTGFGESSRYSDTLMEQMLYYAERLEDGSLVRISMAQSSVLTLILGMLQPLCVVFAVALVLSLILAGRLAKSIVKPLNRLDLDDPLNNEGYDELSPLLRRIHSQQLLLKSSAEDMQRKQQEFAAVTENMGEGLVLLGSGGRVLSINPAAAQILDAGVAAVGLDILAVNRSPELTALLKKAAEGTEAEADIVIDKRAYRLVASPVNTHEGTSGVVLLIFDVTEKARSEQLRREFTANVSHELKTPLHTISGYAELMSRGIAREEDMPRFAGNIYSEAQRMIRLVEDIMRLSQLDEGAQSLQWSDVELSAVAREELSLLQSAAGEAGVTLELTGSQAEIRSIRQLVGTVIHNLCDNAIKYNNPGGKVTVDITDGETEAVLTVSDTGIGIPQEYQSRIFERFYRVDKSRSKEVGGTGLGLSIVKHAALVLDAKITLDSAPEKGTTMTLRFPKSVS